MELSLELSGRLKLRVTLHLKSFAQNPANERRRHRRLVGVERIFDCSLDGANSQFVSLKIVRASFALPAVLEERSAISVAQFALSEETNQADEFAARYLTRHGWCAFHQSLPMPSW